MMAGKGDVDSSNSLDHSSNNYSLLSQLSPKMQLPMGVQLSSPVAREWFQKQRENIRPWMTFLNSHNFQTPATVQQFPIRIAKNIDYFQSNYMFVFIGLILYCLISSPLLLIAVAASFGACYILSTRNADKKIVIAGHEVSLVQQYMAISVLSFPVFYLVGAGAALFWVLGASFFVIILHATFYNTDLILGNDEMPFDSPQIEEVSKPIGYIFPVLNLML